MRPKRTLILTLLAAPMLLAGCGDPPTPAARPAEARTPAKTSAPAKAPALAEAPAPAADSPQAEAARTEAAVLEAALRYRLGDERGDSTTFIALGTMENKLIDPPPGFLNRFKDLPHRFKPVSQARMPKPGEMEAPDRYRGVEDPATGRRAQIYWAQIKERVSETKVRVDAGVWSGPLGGGGGILILELRGGKWVVTDSEGSWVS